MPEKFFKENEEEDGLKKIWSKQLNKFFNDYFRWIIAIIFIFVFIFGFFFLIMPKYSQTVGYISAVNSQEKFDYQAKNEEFKKIKELLKIFQL